ncbi:hypothetical protein VKT23_020283 [Stygiomarasmius scandens]|uniref:Integrase n=1 Tax=Marasmiellus scandens TaxID=2682957 RepID=A0ABR1IJE6_9AGAR
MHKDFSRSLREGSAGHKSKPRWLGPYAIVQRTKGGSYIIRELNGNISRQGIAATRLLPYISRNSPTPQQLASGLPPTDEALETDMPEEIFDPAIDELLDYSDEESA